MKKRLIQIWSIGLSFAFAAQTASAITIDSVDVSWENPRKFYVSGRNDSGMEGESIQIQIVQPEANFDKFKLNSQWQGFFARIAQITTKEDGSFEYEFNIENATTKSGEFTVRIKSNEEDEIATKTFNYASSKVINPSVEAFKAYMGKTEKDSDAIEAIDDLLTSDVKTKYYVNLPIYDTVVNGDVQSDMSEAISYMTPATDGAGMASSIKTAAVLAAAENNLITVSDAFAQYGEALGVKDSDEYKTYSEYKDSDKQVFNSMFSGQKSGKVLKSDEYASLFKNGIVLTELSTANGAGSIATLIEKTYKDSFDLTKYNNNSDKSGICTKIAKAFENGNVKNISDVQALLDSTAPTPIPTKKPSTVGGSSGGGGGGVYTSGNKTYTPAPTKEPKDEELTPTSSVFVDMEDYSWAKDSVEELAKSGIISGVSDKVFAPQDNLTRAQACKIICKVFQIEEENTVSVFGDVASDSWYAPYVAAANAKGIVQGKTDSVFGSDENISRQDFVVMISRALEAFGFDIDSIKESKNEVFTDIDSVAEYAKDFVTAFKDAQIISGRDDGSFDPNGSIVRAEAAVIVYNVKMIYEGRIN